MGILKREVKGFQHRRANCNVHNTSNISSSLRIFTSEETEVSRILGSHLKAKTKSIGKEDYMCFVHLRSMTTAKSVWWAYH